MSKHLSKTLDQFGSKEPKKFRDFFNAISIPIEMPSKPMPKLFENCRNCGANSYHVKDNGSIHCDYCNSTLI